MFVPVFYVHRYMGVQMTGKLSAMNWRVISIGIIKRAKNTIKIDSALFCVMLVFVSDKDLNYSEKPNRPHPKHAGLTKYFKHNWTSETYQVQDIVYGCNVSGRVGALPPELRARVPREQIAQVTAKFHDCMAKFVADYYNNFMQVKCHIDWDMERGKRVSAYKLSDIMERGKRVSAYKLSDISELFGTDCILNCRSISAAGHLRPWRGAIGFVYKLSFPEINADYALKIFIRDTDDFGLFGHGPWFEIPTAFAANHAEPNRNVPIYLASLRDEYYMLTKWAGDAPDDVKQADKNYVIFHTSVCDNRPNNYRKGRRIDFGNTKLTFYGKCSYKERKLARQIIAGDVAAVEKHMDSIKNKLEYKNVDNLVQKIADEMYLTPAMIAFLVARER